MGRSLTARRRDGEARRSAAPRSISDEEVLAAVVELSSLYHAPSTSLVAWQLSGHASTASAAFQAAVRDALRRLQASGRLACVMHRGTHHWTALDPGEQRPA